MLWVLIRSKHISEVLLIGINSIGFHGAKVLLMSTHNTCFRGTIRNFSSDFYFLSCSNFSKPAESDEFQVSERIRRRCKSNLCINMLTIHVFGNVKPYFLRKNISECYYDLNNGSVRHQIIFMKTCFKYSLG